MTGPVEGLHYISEVTEIKYSFILFRVHFPVVGSKYNIIFTHRTCKKLKIVGKTAGIVTQIIFIIELCGIHVDAHHGQRALRYSVFNK